MKRCLLALCLPLGLMGCDHYRTTEGTVRDRTTNRRLEAVKYQALRGDARDSAYDFTNRLGQLHITIMCGRSENLLVQLTKPGYDTLLLKNTPDSVFYITPISGHATNE